MNSYLKKQFEFDEEIFNRNDTMLLCFGLSNILYFIIMLFGCIMPIKVTVIISAWLSAFIALIELTLISYTKHDYKWQSVARLLSYYPTKKINIRISRYRILLRYLLLELIITAIPMIFFFYWFDIVKFAAALATIAATMGVIGTIGIELSIRKN